VEVNRSARKAGQFAHTRFRARHRAWLRRIWWALPLIAILMTGTLVMLGQLFQPHRLEFFFGLGLGAAAAMVICLADSPPHHIERWRQGANGERSTAKALRRLERSGWTAFHDIETDYGNIDHLLIGPAGVFVVETKSLSGLLSVHSDALLVRWREDPDDGYENPRLGARVRGAAAGVADQLRIRGLRTWVQPLIVLWGDFEQVSIYNRGVAWVRGHDLVRVLAHRPTVLSGTELARATAVVAALAQSGVIRASDRAAVSVAA
jgi:hypothetical protein